ncbi:MAG: MltA domain-containing protein [Pseudomonadota bacterium]
MPSFRLDAPFPLLIFLALASCAEEKSPPDIADIGPSTPSYRLVSFDAARGWRDGKQAEVLPVFLRSCAAFLERSPDAPANPREALSGAYVADQPVAEIKSRASVAGVAKDWRDPCLAAAAFNLETIDDETARTFFERHFQAVSVHARRDRLNAPGPALIEDEGTFTGYFEPTYEARRAPGGAFTAPVLARPSDLVMVDLGAFRDALAGERIAGRVVDGRLTPYPDHAAINRGALDGATEVLGFMEPTDLLFLQIQGSGRLQFEDKVVARLGYDGQNGHPYTAIGGVLIREGEIERERMSMQAIRNWLDDTDGDRAQRLREENRSYVFFRRLDALPDPALGPIGASGVQLTALRSLAVDPRFIPLGAPLWVSIEGGIAQSTEEEFNRLFIAQDTGGAIKGPVRGDIFVGSGLEAAAIAGGLNAKGSVLLLLPNAAVDRLPMDRLTEDRSVGARR